MGAAGDTESSAAASALCLPVRVLAKKPPCDIKSQVVFCYFIIYTSYTYEIKKALNIAIEWMIKDGRTRMSLKDVPDRNGLLYVGSPGS
jgi:hypothetical protein